MRELATSGTDDNAERIPDALGIRQVLSALRIGVAACILVGLANGVGTDALGVDVSIVLLLLATGNVTINISLLTTGNTLGRPAVRRQLVVDALLGIAITVMFGASQSPLIWVPLLLPVLGGIMLHSSTAGLALWTTISVLYVTVHLAFPSLDAVDRPSNTAVVQQLLAVALVGVPMALWSTRTESLLKISADARSEALGVAANLRSASILGSELVETHDANRLRDVLLTAVLRFDVDRAELWDYDGLGRWQLNRGVGRPITRQTTMLLDQARRTHEPVTLGTGREVDLADRQDMHLLDCGGVLAARLDADRDSVLRIWSGRNSPLSVPTREVAQVLVASAATALANSKLHAELQSWSGELETMANTDELTGVLNRAGLAASLASMRKHRIPEQQAMIYIDLDGFKLVNDTFGHKAGDHVLKIVSLRFQNLLPSGALLARMGGDEFAVVITDRLAIARLEDIANRLVAAAAAPMRLQSVADLVHIGASAGVAVIPGFLRVDALTSLADEAMYKAKNAGGNNYRVTQES